VWVDGGDELDEPEYMQARQEKEAEVEEEEEGLRMLDTQLGLDKSAKGKGKLTAKEVVQSPEPLEQSQETVVSSVASGE
jgi:hypothetical protein